MWVRRLNSSLEPLQQIGVFQMLMVRQRQAVVQPAQLLAPTSVRNAGTSTADDEAQETT